MNDDFNTQQEHRDFDPWPFLNKIIGLIFISLGMFGLSNYQGSAFLASKVALVAAGGFWGLGFRHPLTGRVQPLFLLGMALIPLGLGLAFLVIEPRVFNLLAGYSFGGLALVFGGRRLTLKYNRKIE